MREVMFRGKRVSDGTWVYGDLLTQYPHHNGATIVEHGCIHHEVDPDTVAQFIGMYDKNNKKIYYEDIFASEKYPFTSNGERNYLAIVRWFDDASAFGCEIIKVSNRISGISDGVYSFLEGNGSDFEVIGNIHDNPELLGIEANV